MNKKNYFYKYSALSVVKNVLIILLGIAVLAAFYIYRLYVAMIFLSVMLIVVILDSLDMIIITDTDISELRFLKVRVCIPFDEIELIDTKAGRQELITFFGTGDLITTPYNEKLLALVCERLGLSKSCITMYMRLTETKKINEGDYVLETEAVRLDSIYGKKRYVHRSIKRCEAKRAKERTFDNC